ncbi:MAG: DUF4440 domain-containing protein [Gemmatimonadota bacterium]|nr:DUF4440 domain-containing protein [Gemmatimonadota bacterium]
MLRRLGRRSLLVPALFIVFRPIAAQEVDLAGLGDLLEPRIAVRDAETVIQVRATGDPNSVGTAAFGLLFQLYFTSPSTPKGPDMPTPKARWPSPEGTPPAEWVGLYALAVPSGTDLPGHQALPGVEATVTTWEYGTVAEVLHVGPYDAEQPTLEALREFARAEGYEVVPGHEEEYVRGPSMSGPGNPEEYLTILRYRVRRPGEPDADGRAAVLAAREASNAAIRAHDLDAITSFWTDDILMTAGSGTGEIGIEFWTRAIDEQIRSYPDVVYVRTPEAVEISAVAPLASERGRWIGTWTAEAGPVESGGTYQAMWRKEGGEWRIRSQLFVTLTCEGSGCVASRTP